uniref:Uncharacterized protein n=1 Tax=Arundo donax TaxID=35708 RepID=A0A0A9T5W9_ARUDO
MATLVCRYPIFLDSIPNGTLVSLLF